MSRARGISERQKLGIRESLILDDLEKRLANRSLVEVEAEMVAARQTGYPGSAGAALLLLGAMRDERLNAAAPTFEQTMAEAKAAEARCVEWRKRDAAARAIRLQIKSALAGEAPARLQKLQEDLAALTSVKE